MTKSTTFLLTFALTSSVVFVGCQSKSGLQTQPVAQTSTPSTQTATNTTVKTISANTTYQSPGGTEQIGFHISVDANGLITDAKTDVLSQDTTGIMRQTAFANGLLSVIKGKKLSDLGPIDRVAGSSLTTSAFNAALAQLKAQL